MNIEAMNKEEEDNFRRALEMLAETYNGDINAMMADLRRMREPSTMTASEPAQHPGDFPAFSIPSTSDHYCYPGLTARQYAAIKLHVPDSGQPWLNEMINKARRDYFAGQALAGHCGFPVQESVATKFLVQDAFAIADAMLAANEPKEGHV